MTPRDARGRRDRHGPAAGTGIGFPDRSYPRGGTFVGPTVAALTELAPELIVPGHCTGRRARHALAGALPDAWVQTSVGTTCTLGARQAAGA
ncbi:hypothetical protein ACFV5G_06160 [Streptomyces sp. NPDC059766]|uniref:hypothetical protein n=1 Tax=Streptomyces sp. NPDC059766 TaxID=3346940 RepID=UPI00365B05DE